MTIPLKNIKPDDESMILPDSIDVYGQLLLSKDIDEDLDESHIMYSYITIMAEEVLFRSKELRLKLGRWYGERWRKLKSSSRVKRTDKDVKTMIEGDPKYIRKKKEIYKYEKVHRQLAFGSAKPLDMKARNLGLRITRMNRMLGDFGIRDDNITEKVKGKINERIKVKKGRK